MHRTQQRKLTEFLSVTSNYLVRRILQARAVRVVRREASFDGISFREARRPFAKLG